MVILPVVALGYVLFGVGGAVVAVPGTGILNSVGSQLRGAGNARTAAAEG